MLGAASPLELRAWVAHGPLLTESDAGEWPRVNDALNLVVRRRYFTLEDRDSDPRGSYQLIFSVSFSPEMHEYLSIRKQNAGRRQCTKDEDTSAFPIASRPNPH